MLKSCFEATAKADSSPFSFVVAIGSDGKAVKIYYDRQTNIFLCIRRSLENDAFPAPPISPFYMHIEMEFPDGDVPKPPLVLEPDKYSYTFAVPKSWEYSFEKAQQWGVRLVFFPKGGSFDKSNSIIYVTEVNSVCRPICEGNVSSAVELEIHATRNDSPALQVASESAIKIDAGGEAIIRIFTGLRDPRQPKEALAFIEHKQSIVLVVLTTKDTRTWNQDYSVFQEIVSSHKFFACDSPELATPCKK